MKTMKMKMVSLFWILGFFWISVNSNSQDSKLSRHEKKEVEKARMALNFNILDSLLNAKRFVLEADMLRNKYGEIVNVVPTLNFIKVDESNGVLQTGSNFSMGYNGVGGVTAEGSLGGWKISKNSKKLNYVVQFSLLTNLGNFDVSMTVSANNHAVATIRGLGPGDLTWDGHLVTINNSGVFKGRNTY
jgi:hypothetical protein